MFSKSTLSDVQTPMEIVARAEAALEAGAVVEATELMGTALSAAPRDPAVLTAFGSMLAEVGNTEKAILTLQKAARLSPSSGYEKFMYLGQLLDDSEEADAAYCTGIELLKGDIDSAEERGQDTIANALRPSLASAICSLVELRLRSARDVSSISESCVALLEQAHEIDPSSPEPEQASASLQHELGDLEAALRSLRSSMQKWWQPGHDADVTVDDDDQAAVGCVRVSTGQGAEEEGSQSAGRDDPSDDVDMPSYEFRVEACKLLIELDSSTDTAIEVLESLLCEHDEAPHTWYLLALAHYGGGDFDAALETLEHGGRFLHQSVVEAQPDAQEMYHELRERIHEGQALVSETDAQVT